LHIDNDEVLILYNSDSKLALPLANKLAEKLGIKHSLLSTHDDGPVDLPQNARLLVTIGGDGTLLRAARITAGHNISLLGVNLGRLGFLTEIEANDAIHQVPQYLAGDDAFWIDERRMIRSEAFNLGNVNDAVHALNDIVVGRGRIANLSRIGVSINDAELTTYQADAVIVATATGSTAYALSAGGPILYPLSSDIVIVPVATHGDLDAPVVVPGSSKIKLEIKSEHDAFMTADGFIDIPMSHGSYIEISSSPHTTQFLRKGSPDSFYETLVYRLRRGSEQSMNLARKLAEEDAKRFGSN
tara:strand:+ start:1359 stop:2258 length:900 start_codon:yes stop_codon:yes gene_type:complete